MFIIIICLPKNQNIHFIQSGVNGTDLQLNLCVCWAVSGDLWIWIMKEYLGRRVLVFESHHHTFEWWENGVPFPSWVSNHIQQLLFTCLNVIYKNLIFFKNYFMIHILVFKHIIMIHTYIHKNHPFSNHIFLKFCTRLIKDL